jgi:transposase
MKIKDGRKLSNEALQQLRRDVILYLNEGNTAVATAAHFGISRRAVEKYKSLYALLGKDGLTMGKRGKPSKPKLGVKEQQHICKCIVDKNCNTPLN